ncbi:MAG: hypothetical protein ACJ8GN_14985 [Longimicrobiaceae bacterium]
MTTPIPDFLRLHEIQDVDSLRVLRRVVESQLTMAEAQVNQLQQLRGALDERTQALGKVRK